MSIELGLGALLAAAVVIFVALPFLRAGEGPRAAILMPDLVAQDLVKHPGDFPFDSAFFELAAHLVKGSAAAFG